MELLSAKLSRFNSLSPKHIGALWGAALFLCLWLGTLGTIGGFLLLVPAVYIPGIILSFFGIAISLESIFWRAIGVLIYTAGFALIGGRYGPGMFSAYKNLSKTIRITMSVFLVTIFVLIILVGRSLRMHD
jgi:hypothetical protein